jgi:hypothetical protein
MSCTCVVIFLYVVDGLRHFCCLVPKQFVYDGNYTSVGVTVLGEILEVASFIATPLGAILAVSVAAAAFFYGRWVLAD